MRFSWLCFSYSRNIKKNSKVSACGIDISVYNQPILISQSPECLIIYACASKTIEVTFYLCNSKFIEIKLISWSKTETKCILLEKFKNDFEYKLSGRTVIFYKKNELILEELCEIVFYSIEELNEFDGMIQEKMNEFYLSEKNSGLEKAKWFVNEMEILSRKI